MGGTGYKVLNCAGKKISLEKPVVMGILNITPDSFYDGGALFKPSRPAEAGQEDAL